MPLHLHNTLTDFVEEQLAMIEALHEKGHAYEVDGELLYEIETFPEYGRLSGNTLAAQQVGASGRVQEDVSRKRHPGDFSLWKPGKPGEPLWSTGREGWESALGALLAAPRAPRSS